MSKRCALGSESAEYRDEVGGGCEKGAGLCSIDSSVQGILKCDHRAGFSVDTLLSRK